MSERSEAPTTTSEETELHSRLLRANLAIGESRAYWLHADAASAPDAQTAFERFWFGEKTLRRVRVLLGVMQSRFGHYPQALEVLRRWRVMVPETRNAICHWHVQLSDPLYRAFTGTYLAARRASGSSEIGRRAVVQWIADQDQGRWSMSTRTELASRLLSTAHGAGLVTGRSDPRGIGLPRIPDEALTYLLQLLRTLRFEGSITRNLYLASVGLDDHALERRLRSLPDLRYRREGDTIDIEWKHPSLMAWAIAGPLPELSDPDSACQAQWEGAER